MRVGVLTTSYPRGPTDAAGLHVAGLARWLVARGAAVEVVAAGPGDSHDGPIPIHRVGTRGLFYGGGAPEALARSWAARAAAPGFVGRLFAVAQRRARRWDAVITHWLLPCGLVGVALAGRRPHVAIAHSSDVHLLGRLPAGRLGARALARSSARLVFVSDELRRRFGRLCGRTVGTVAAMGTVRPPLAPPPPPRDAPLAVLFLGRLVPIKGLPVLLAAARALPRVSVVIAGEGPLGPSLGRGAPDNVRFVGPLCGSAKAAALAAAHLLCVPSLPEPDGRTEGAPVVVAEAQAAGRPVVASATGGLPESVGDAGVLVPPGDPAALAHALGRLDADRALLAELAERARARGPARDWSVAGPQILGEAFLRRLAANGLHEGESSCTEGEPPL